MPSKSVDRGRAFEIEIRDVLLAFQAEHTERVQVDDHSRMTLHDGQEVIPDFVLVYEMPDSQHVITIECQSRERSQKDIANKIRTMKALSNRNRFFFVYRDHLPEATRKALDADGTATLSYSGFVNYIAKLSAMISFIDESSMSLLVLPDGSVVRQDTWIRNEMSGRDLRLMSSVKDVSGIPTEGKNLIIVAAVDQALHFRIFDDDGKKVVDEDGKRLTKHARLIEALRKQLESLWPPHELTRSEKGQVTDVVTSIFGYTCMGGRVTQFCDLNGEWESPVVKPGFR
jgi:hypothetical protein